jgi:cytidyltransferase-like protein
MKRKAIIVSGYFNPIHKGPLEYFNNAKSLADELCVIVNSDLQRSLKKSKEFQKEDERLFIVQNIKADDTAIISIDKDRTVSASIAHLYKTSMKSMILVSRNAEVRIIIQFLKRQFVMN